MISPAVRFSALLPVTRLASGYVFTNPPAAESAMIEEFKGPLGYRPSQLRIAGLAIVEFIRPDHAIHRLDFASGLQLFGIIVDGMIHVGRDFTRAAFSGLHKVSDAIIDLKVDMPSEEG